MTPALSPNTQAILLLTAPLIAGREPPSSDLLTPGEYKRLARQLRENKHQPADLLSPDAAELVRAFQPVIDESRLQRLLGRGFLLSQVIERWQSRAIWVVSRADAEYPRRLKARLREDAPALIYGCGDISLMDSGGLAAVGSRDVDGSLIDYTISIGRLAARAGKTIVSGGAKGIDQAAMRGALEADGNACVVLPGDLESTAMKRELRNALIEGRLALVSAYDPSARFRGWQAMQRNKLIYALADAALVVESSIGSKSGTWSGAVEQLDKLKFVPLYVRSNGESSAGLEDLLRKGALPWPNPQDADGFGAVFELAAPTSVPPAQSGPELFLAPSEPVPPTAISPIDESVESTPEPAPSPALTTEVTLEATSPMATTSSTPADTLYVAVRDVIQLLLKSPMKDAEVAAALNVSTAQAKAWLQRLIDEGAIEKQKKPAGYIVKRSSLFE